MNSNEDQRKSEFRIRFPRGSVVMIAAVDEAMGIGRRGVIPWDVPSDRAFFRRQTMGGAVIMGRVTFESLPLGSDGRRGLDGRLCAVLSHRERSAEAREGVLWGRNADELLQRGRAYGVVYVAGGASVYRALWAKASDVLISRIRGDWDCDASFVAVGEPECRLQASWATDGFVLEWWRKIVAFGV